MPVRTAQCDAVAHNLLTNDKLEAYPTSPPLSVDRILGQATPAAAPKLAPRARDILARINLCRTVALGRRRYDCQDCEQPVRVYNSCGERHCPTCSGSVRADWLERTAETLVPHTEYLQLVFTIPDTLAELFLDNPRVTYNLLMQTAWRELKKFLEKIGVKAGALIVLHTWNQRLGHHPHLHVLIPAGGISLDGTRWLRIDHHPSLAAGNQWELGRKFRDTLCRRLRRLHAKGKLQFRRRVCPRLAFPQAAGSDSGLQFEQREFQEWLDAIAPRGFRVFVQPPPTNSTDPIIILKYLARYVSGGPISNSRLVSWENGQVTFLARSKEVALPGQAKEKVPITISEVEFVRRWATHILPKGFTRVRHYGMSVNRHRAAYLKKCRELLGIDDKQDNAADDAEQDSEPVDRGTLKKKAPRCQRTTVPSVASRCGVSNSALARVGK